MTDNIKKNILKLYTFSYYRIQYNINTIVIDSNYIDKYQIILLKLYTF